MVATNPGRSWPAPASRRDTRRGNGARRRTRRSAVLLLAACALGTLGMIGWAAPASAHGREVLLKVSATTPSLGAPTKVTAIATFLDGDKAGGVPLKAVATGPGKPVSAPLKASGPRGTYTATLRLSPGRWKITVTAAGEHTGRGTASLTVAEPTTTTTTTTTTSPPSTTAPATSLAAQPAAAGASSGGGRGMVVAGILVAAAALLGGAILLAARRGSKQPRTPAR